MSAIRGKKMKMVKEGTLITPVDIGNKHGLLHHDRWQGHKALQVREHEGRVPEVLVYDRRQQEQVWVH